jgi:hypothetical protein
MLVRAIPRAYQPCVCGPAALSYGRHAEARFQFQCLLRLQVDRLLGVPPDSHGLGLLEKLNRG